MKNFNNYCRDFVIDNLSDYEGNTYYMCDLGSYITEGINVDGSATYNTEEAKKYIREWWEEAGEYHQYEKDNFGEVFHNPFENPEVYMVCMIIEGVRSLLSQCDIVDENWNDEVELTSEVIECILQQVKNKKVEW